MKLIVEVQYQARLVGYLIKPAMRGSFLMFEVVASNGQSDLIGISVRNKRELNAILHQLDPNAMSGDDPRKYLNQTCLVECTRRNGIVRIYPSEHEIAF